MKYQTHKCKKVKLDSRDAEIVILSLEVIDHANRWVGEKLWHKMDLG